MIEKGTAHLFPGWTVMTDRGDAGPPEVRPRPLIRVESGILRKICKLYGLASDLNDTNGSLPACMETI
jgi:hypothetical protein